MKKRRRVRGRKGDQKQIVKSSDSSLEINKNGIKGIGPWGVPGAILAFAMLLFAAWHGVKQWI
jgi:hypothetical protein